MLRKLGYILLIRFRAFQFPWFDNPDLNLIYHCILTSSIATFSEEPFLAKTKINNMKTQKFVLWFGLLLVCFSNPNDDIELFKFGLRDFRAYLWAL